MSITTLLSLLGEPKVVYNELASALGIGSLG